ncbi:unnamed protein product [Paramecium primaurelia]|uniref:Uncharacterized protein n=1 Tax=Paramecium primaurelia TaxID=5886 RepID=A0A8S1MUZ8_PARPR|nr:unnamed protein product [Paramecium primaurelia]
MRVNSLLMDKNQQQNLFMALQEYSMPVNNLSANNEILVNLNKNWQVKVWKLKIGKCLKILESTVYYQIRILIQYSLHLITYDYIHLKAESLINNIKEIVD